MFRKNIKNSRNLRRAQTPHEQKLWKLLRSRRLNLYKFRRQHPIGDYIVDFCCVEKRIVIELDGSGHAEPTQERRDVVRDQYLSSQGYEVIRVWNNEVDENIEKLMDLILEKLGV